MWQSRWPLQDSRGDKLGAKVLGERIEKDSLKRFVTACVVVEFAAVLGVADQDP